MTKKSINERKKKRKTLPKALRTQAVTTLTSHFSLECLVHLTQLAKFGLAGLVWFGRFGLVGLVR